MLQLSWVCLQRACKAAVTAFLACAFHPAATHRGPPPTRAAARVAVPTCEWIAGARPPLVCKKWLTLKEKGSAVQSSARWERKAQKGTRRHKKTPDMKKKTPDMKKKIRTGSRFLHHAWQLHADRRSWRTQERLSTDMPSFEDTLRRCDPPSESSRRD